MHFEQKLDTGRPSLLIVALATILVFFAVACLLIRRATAPLGATPPAAGPSYEAENEQPSSNSAEAARAPAARIPAAQTAAAQAPAAQTPAAWRPAEPALSEQIATGPAAPDQGTEDPAADQLSASEQISFKSRRSLETVDPREFLRRAATPPPNVTK